MNKLYVKDTLHRSVRAYLFTKIDDERHEDMIEIDEHYKQYRFRELVTLNTTLTDYLVKNVINMIYEYTEFERVAPMYKRIDTMSLYTMTRRDHVRDWYNVDERYGYKFGDEYIGPMVRVVTFGSCGNKGTYTKRTSDGVQKWNIGYEAIFPEINDYIYWNLEQ